MDRLLPTAALAAVAALLRPEGLPMKRATVLLDRIPGIPSIKSVASISMLALVACTEAPTATSESAAARHPNPAYRSYEVPTDGRGPLEVAGSTSFGRTQAATFNTITVGAPADGSNIFPFAGGFSNFGGANRYQQAYAASQFNSAAPILIRSISFVGGQGTFATSTYAFSLSTTATGIDNLSTTNFDANRGIDNTLLASLNLSGTAPATLRIESSTPFLYDPSSGNLLLDIVVSPGNVFPVALGASYHARSNAFGIMSRYHNFGTGFIGYGLVTQFELAPLTIATVVAAIDQAVATGALRGVGEGNSATQRLAAWLNMLRAAEQSDAHGNDAGACGLLKQVYLRSDGVAQPPDFVAGSATRSIANLVQALRTASSCD